MIGNFTTFFRLSQGLALPKQPNLLQKTLPQQFFTQAIAIQRLAVSVPRPTITALTPTARFSTTSHNLEGLKPIDNQVSEPRYLPNAIHTFFAGFPSFDYDPSKHYHPEVQRFYSWVTDNGIPLDIQERYKAAELKPIDEFLQANYPDFKYTYNEKTPVYHIFEQLRIHMGWPSRKQRANDSIKKQKNYQSFLAARTAFRAAQKTCAAHVHVFLRSTFPTLPFDPQAPYESEYLRLCRARGWVPESLNLIHKQCRKAQVTAFGEMFGKTELDRKNWLRLFSAVGVNPEDVPLDITTCKEVSTPLSTPLLQKPDPNTTARKCYTSSSTSSTWSTSTVFSPPLDFLPVALL